MQIYVYAVLILFIVSKQRTEHPATDCAAAGIVKLYNY